MIQNQLLIAGDSWGVGEFHLNPDNTLFKNGPGVGEMLSENNNVVNISKGGNSNWQILLSVHSYLNHYSNLVDKVIIFQTDAGRSKSADLFNIDYADIIKNASDINLVYSSLTEIFYIKLNEIFNKYKIPIYLLGGITDVDDELIKLYPNINVLCNSWISLLYPTHKHSTIPIHLPQTDKFDIDVSILKYLRTINRGDLFNQLLKLLIDRFDELNEILCLETMGPVFCDFHPSSKGHRIMSDFIINYFQKLNNTQ